MPPSSSKKQIAKSLRFKEPLLKLDPNRGGYFYLTVPAEVAKQFPKGKSTRLICIINEKIELSSGLNHLKNGDFFIIVATRHVKALKKKAGDVVEFTIREDSRPLGVEMPEVLEALLEQDADLAMIFEGLTDGKKRSLIFMIMKLKDVDKQIQNATRFLSDVKNGRSPFKRK